MRVTAFSLILLFVCLNVSLYILNETEVLPSYMPPYENPDDITNRLVLGLGILGGGALLAALSGNSWVGLAALTVWIGSIMLPVFNWGMFGFAEFLGQMASMSGDPTLPLILVNGVKAMMAVVWLWFLMQLIGQRYVET